MEAIHWADFYTIHVFALNACFGYDEGHLTLLVVLPASGSFERGTLIL